MTLQSIRKAMVLMTALVLLSSAAFSETRYDRDLVVKDETRAMKVEKVFKDLIAAYEDEDPQGFLDLVSDDRFRQDYITFTDALYSDFRNYEIHRVDYWVDRVVSDHIKQFLFVKWEKRYETLEDGRQETQLGNSRFLFDEVNGKYLLIELAGNHLFGGSLDEWKEEVPIISGQRPEDKKKEKVTSGQSSQELIPSTGGTIVQQDPASTCALEGGYWDGSACYKDAEAACTAKNRYWYNGTCNSTPGIPDLTISISKVPDHPNTSSPDLQVIVTNIGNIESGSYSVAIEAEAIITAELFGTSLSPLESKPFIIPSETYLPPMEVKVTQTTETTEINTDNNTDQLFESDLH